MTLIHGADSSDVLRKIAVDSDGQLQVDVLSAALPSGAMTEATGLLIKTAVQSLANALVSAALDTLRANIIAALPAGTNNIGDVDVVSSTLPTGAATEATLATLSTEATLSALKTLVDSLENALASIATDKLRVSLVDALPAGTNNIGDVDVLSSVLPTGAATQATLATLLTEAIFTGRLGEVQASPTANTVLDRLKQLLTGIVLAAGTNNIGDVDVLSSALPTGASTAANQSTANTALSAIQTAVQLIDNVISGSEAQVDIVAAPVLQVQNENGDMLDAFESVYVSNQSNLNAPAGYDELTDTAVAAGKVLKVTSVTVYNENNIATFVQAYIYNGTLAATLVRRNTPAAFEAVNWTGVVYLPAGYYVVGGYGGTILNDNIRLQVCGVLMDAP